MSAVIFVIFILCVVKYNVLKCLTSLSIFRLPAAKLRCDFFFFYLWKSPFFSLTQRELDQHCENYSATPFFYIHLNAQFAPAASDKTFLGLLWMASRMVFLRKKKYSRFFSIYLFCVYFAASVHPRFQRKYLKKNMKILRR